MAGAADPRGGTELAGGFWAVVYINRGDLEWLTKHFGLPKVTALRPCGLCRCSNAADAAVPWTDVNYPPVWADHLVSDEVWDGVRERLWTLFGPRLPGKAPFLVPVHVWSREIK